MHLWEIPAGEVDEVLWSPLLVLVMLLLSYTQLSLQLVPVSPSLPCSSQYQSQCPKTSKCQQPSENISFYVGAWLLIPSPLSPLSTGYYFLQRFPSAVRAGWGSSVRATELAGKRKGRARVAFFLSFLLSFSLSQDHFSCFHFPCSSETPAHPATGTLLFDMTPQKWLLYKEVNSHAAVYRQPRQPAQRVPSCIGAAPWACSGKVVLSPNHRFSSWRFTPLDLKRKHARKKLSLQAAHIVVGERSIFFSCEV